MIIYIFGNDYLVFQKTKELIGEYQKKNPTGFNLVYFNAEEKNLTELESSLKNESLIPEKKLIVLKNPEILGGENLKNLFSRFNILESQLIFILIPTAKTLDSDLSKFFKQKPNKVFEFKDLSFVQKRQWLLKLAQNFEVNFDSQALDFLVFNWGQDLWRLDNEVRKISCFKPKEPVSLSDIKLLVQTEAPWDLFDLTDALLMRNRSAFLNILDKALKGGAQAAQITSILVWQLTALLRVKETLEKNPQISQIEIAKRLRLNSFVVKKILPQTRFFNIPEVKKLLNWLFDFDLKTKTQEVDEILNLSVFATFF